MVSVSRLRAVYRGFAARGDALIVKGDFSRIPQEPDRGWRPIEDQVPTFKGYSFFSAISKGPVACNLAIRIERRGLPGSLFEHDGDLDNRLKTLLDALKVPRNENEVTDPPTSLNSQTKARGYCPCLLEDDSMVTGLSITTIPSLESMSKGHVRITIEVEIKAHDLMFDEEA